MIRCNASMHDGGLVLKVEEAQSGPRVDYHILALVIWGLPFVLFRFFVGQHITSFTNNGDKKNSALYECDFHKTINQICDFRIMNCWHFRVETTLSSGLAETWD